MNILLNAGFTRQVFENRNQKFGAFFLRKSYSKNLFRGFLIGLLITLVIIYIPVISSHILPKEDQKKTQVVEVILEDIPSIVEKPEALTPPPPPPPKIEKPKISKVKFLPPVVKPDDEIEVEELPPTDSQLEESNPGDQNQEGDKDAIEIEPVPEQAIVEEKEEIYVYVPKMPEFKGGQKKFISYLSNNLEYPAEAEKNQIEGKVYVEFYVDKDGSIKDIKILKSLGYGCDEAAIRVIKNSPKWNPGMKDGKPVAVKQRIPINFYLE